MRPRHVTEPNIEFHLGDGQRLPLPDASVMAVFSTHVFQHFESVPDSVPVFEDIARVLQPGGSVMIHLPLYQYPHPASRLTRLVRMEYAARKKLADAVAAWKRWQLKRNKTVPLVRGTCYDAVALRAAAAARVQRSGVRHGGGATPGPAAPHGPGPQGRPVTSSRRPASSG
jgi:SAM-dependent methyltransferase